MVVVGHEAVGVAQPVITLVDVLKGIEEVLAVLVVLEDGIEELRMGLAAA